jgi:hypothetical protein
MKVDDVKEVAEFVQTAVAMAPVISEVVDKLLSLYGPILSKVIDAVMEKQVTNNIFYAERYKIAGFSPEATLALLLNNKQNLNSIIEIVQKSTTTKGK